MDSFQATAFTLESVVVLTTLVKEELVSSVQSVYVRKCVFAWLPTGFELLLFVSTTILAERI